MKKENNSGKLFSEIEFNISDEDMLARELLKDFFIKRADVIISYCGIGGYITAKKFVEKL